MYPPPRPIRLRSWCSLLALTLVLGQLLLAGLPLGAQDSELPALIPTPRHVEYSGGEVAFTSVAVADGDWPQAATQLRAFLVEEGIPLSDAGLPVRFANQPVAFSDSKEAYRIRVDSSVTVTAPARAAAAYAVATLRQLFRKRDGEGILPRVSIEDWPAFAIRGFLHDTGRNFQSIEQLREQIEVLAAYKYNLFHWHLTDDPGWRLESKRYPELQSARATTRNAGKFYTQEEFREMIKFCRERNITVVPEFDLPGHSAAFRRAFGLQSMAEPRALEIVLDLFAELTELADAETMPYVHIGTDEVRNAAEAVPDSFLTAIIRQLEAAGRQVIVWEEGLDVPGDTTSIQQLWARHPPGEGRRFIDSRANYINHLDPFAGMTRLFFQQPTRQPRGDSLALGGILCAWPDNRVAHERDILRQNPVYPAMVFYADAIWHGREANQEAYWANLPPPGTPAFEAFRAFENKVITHRDRYFAGREFPYLRQTDLHWRLIGPFDHAGNPKRSFPVEDTLRESYEVGGPTYPLSGPYAGATLHLKHFFGFPAVTEASSGTFYAFSRIYSPDDRMQDFWIGFQGWSRSGGRRGGPTPERGQWHHSNPQVWVNGNEIAPPAWRQPGVAAASDEIPFVDEDYFYRTPTAVPLRRGWNDILLKVPHTAAGWKWMFTCVPVRVTEAGVREATGLIYSTPANLR
ncbi:hypothetical protein GGR26_003408 [Lewinella marina]|uniref:beta-N-acetylhexosaminidase n=1 Tax=Neolewinella marina TaxID=438751 RepID=A0A2G0CCI1_9BACT|nr:family 20 glycosylhydrolase [Neolewinella marina]NJB87624.1 hypothetical protein [Neolewinella marina]PHK97688.1 hypothetical protein CGL56_14775 [Neolewinella marina]